LRIPRAIPRAPRNHARDLGTADDGASIAPNRDASIGGWQNYDPAAARGGDLFSLDHARCDRAP